MGGWLQAGRLPADEALTWAEEHLSQRRWDAYTKNLQIWASTLPAHIGGTPPDPPEPPED